MYYNKKTETEKLDFRLLEYSVLEASFEGGVISIYGEVGNGFTLHGWCKHENFHATCSNIYEALDKANEWYYEQLREQQDI